MNSQSSQILILTHGGWGSALKASLGMILGQIDGVSELALSANDTFAEFYQKAAEQVAKMPAGSLLITDFIGGTPSNVAARLSLDYQIGVIAGLNATLLIEAIERRHEGPLMQIVDELVAVGQAACKNVLAEIQSKQEQ